MVNIGYLITSTQSYYKITLPLLFSTIPQEQRGKFMVVVSNAPEDKIETSEGFEFHFIKDWHLAWSGVIELLKFPPKYKYYFGMPCTCKLGPDFFNSVEGFDDQDWDCIRASNGIDSLGTYSFQYFLSQKDWIEAMGCSKTEEVKNETRLMYNAKKYTCYSSTWNVEKGYDDIYKTGTTRQIVHYPGVDLYKFKANWGQTSEGEKWIMHP